MITRKSDSDLLSMRADKLMLFRISGDKDSLGKILDVNFETAFQLQYEKHELIGANVKKLLPSIFAIRHDEWIVHSYANMSFPKLNRVTQGFIQNKSGFFVFINLIVKLVPNLKEGVNFIGASHINKRMSGYVRLMEEASHTKKGLCVFLCDEAGRVIGISEATGKYFGVSGREFSAKSEVMIQSLLPMITDKEFEAQAKSKEGHICNVNAQEIGKQIGDTDRSDDGNGNEVGPKQPYRKQKRRMGRNQLLCWIKVIDELQGEATGLPCCMRIVVVLPISSRIRAGSMH
ncbi:MAG: hypothetical protein P4M11_04815 [Candidatus Pacebacteria bacterium]|nr:hypothetical protein [Candidatus Paceibacterota bacterium]